MRRLFRLNLIDLAILTVLCAVGILWNNDPMLFAPSDPAWLRVASVMAWGLSVWFWTKVLEVSTTEESDQQYPRRAGAILTMRCMFGVPYTIMSYGAGVVTYRRLFLEGPSEIVMFGLSVYVASVLLIVTTTREP